ncbi:hypothetical protein SDC9_174853 [bioreactor metagenome]|uniref:Uncharacterized protein n=1 Tax=bioreactor metagenome TaxID=1076179 RepID=A0A645GML8_9ZZZZ
MFNTAFFTAFGEASPTRLAVLMTPTPSGLVRIRLSPGLAPAFEKILPGCTIPFTERPYLIGSSLMLCPPTRHAPASRTLYAPPFKISFKISGSSFSGKHTILSAVSTSPPMAYTSLIALAAAICPNRNGSSVMGVKKSSVWTIATSSLIRYTAASSDLS